MQYFIVSAVLLKNMTGDFILEFIQYVLLAQVSAALFVLSVSKYHRQDNVPKQRWTTSVRAKVSESPF